MTQTKPTEGSPKIPRARRAPQRDGMKLVRLWVPDPSRPGFKDEAARQATLLKAAPEETESLDFIGSAFTWPEP
jgi:hypothetical protein